MFHNQYEVKDNEEKLNSFMTYDVLNITNETESHYQPEPFIGADNPMHWTCLEHRLSWSQIAQIQAISYWIEGICQFSIGSIGIISNMLAIPILCSFRIKSIFNNLLISLLILHTVYLICVVLTEMILQVWVNDPQTISKTWILVSFSYVLRPLKHIMQYSSTFLTTLMARQRFLAIRHPIEYRNSTLTANLWTNVIKSLILVLLIAGLFSFPLYFEESIKYAEMGHLQFDEFNKTNYEYVSTSSFHK
jgi:hypothetical protein